MNKMILLIEDDPNITDFMEVVFEREQYRLTVAKKWDGSFNCFTGRNI